MNNCDKYDVVHVHSYHALPALYAAQAKRGNKLVITPRYRGKAGSFFRIWLHIVYKHVTAEMFATSS